ncbi:hypothetical protein [Streptomyces sp. NPDC047972]|uniref:hypothetical protein n=1 Tax=Streptomyces sp. NPDC047972 TaxID=3365493 RepID=UPI003712550F
MLITKDIISSAQLTSIINKHGAGYLLCNRSLHDYYSSADELEMDESEKFEVLVNYGFPVQFHLVGSSDGVMVTTGLKGTFDDESMTWVAED